MSENYREVEFVTEAAGERLDKALAARFKELSRVQIQDLIREGMVTVNARPVKASHRLEGGETIWIKIPVPQAIQGPQPEAIPLVMLYEDDQVAVIDKPAGMVVHPAFGHTSGTLVNAVLARWPEIASFSTPERAGIVHRLDKETSGVILIAKSAAALNRERELNLFRRYNFLKYFARESTAALKPSRASSAQLSKIEQYLAEAEVIKKIITEAHLRLVVSIASKHAAASSVNRACFR